MSELPVSQSELEKVALMSDLLSKIREYSEANSSVSDIHFTPIVKGYEVSFTYKRSTYKLIIIIRIKQIKKWKILNKMRILVFKNNFLKKEFLSECNEDNDNLMDIIFS